MITALLMFFVERVSPLSGSKVEPGTDPKPRIFSLKESFYFAVSSITPEGRLFFSKTSFLYVFEFFEEIKDIDLTGIFSDTYIIKNFFVTFLQKNLVNVFICTKNEIYVDIFWCINFNFLPMY